MFKQNQMAFYKRIVLDNAFNVRDIGGYSTSDNSIVKWKAFIRGEELNFLSKSDVVALYEYGVRTVIDLRFPFEAIQNKHFSEMGIVYKNISLLDKYADFGGRYYQHLIDNCGENMKILFDYICQRIEYGGILYHCAAGRDRTGVATALLLLLCGVSDDDIIADYSVTSIYLKPFAARHKLTSEDIMSNPDEMERFIIHVKEKYKNAEQYLLSIGLSESNINKLKKFLMLGVISNGH